MTRLARTARKIIDGLADGTLVPDPPLVPDEGVALPCGHDGRVANAIRRAGGCSLTPGWWAEEGDPCLCCSTPAVGTGSGIRGSNLGGIFRDSGGGLAWACRACWEQYSPNEVPA